MGWCKGGTQAPVRWTSCTPLRLLAGYPARPFNLTLLPCLVTFFRGGRVVKPAKRGKDWLPRAGLRPLVFTTRTVTWVPRTLAPDTTGTKKPGRQNANPACGLRKPSRPQISPAFSLLLHDFGHAGGHIADGGQHVVFCQLLAAHGVLAGNHLHVGLHCVSNP